ncbi:MAG: hypothetical protein Q9O74_07230 [Planctomycetota bacterium]|nr:hypothetical protein [Planctomycetota bacterium]
MDTDSMILAKWKVHWYIASKINPETPSCALVAGNWPEVQSLGFIKEVRSVGTQGQSGYSVNIKYHRYMSTMSDITFYPELHYWGMRVTPEHWHFTSPEPLLFCRLMDNEIFLATRIPGGPEALKRAVEKKDKHAEAEWRRIGEANSQTLAAMRRKLLADGWEDHGMDGLVKYVHVDDLEKIEGPPPRGPF